MGGKKVFSKKNNSSHGLNAKITNTILIFFGCLLIFTIVVASYSIKGKYTSIVNTMKDYADCTKAVNNFRDASLYLTNQARLYSVNLNTSFADNYFRERNDYKRREGAVNIIELSHDDDNASINIHMALRESQFLEKTEIYAMALVAHSTGVELSTLPEELQNVQLTDYDNNLSKEAKLQKARELLFNSQYISGTDKIASYCNNVQSTLVIGFLRTQSVADISIQQYFKFQLISVIALLIVIITLYTLLIVFIILPLSENCRSIEKGNKMIVKGCSEVRVISKIYNHLYDKNTLTTSDLKHKAEHDPLTGLINRSGLIHIKEVLKTIDEPIAYLIVDIDFFKTINDTYGHLVGDEVLKRIANILSKQFRNSDYVSRIGGDEFAVLMTKIGSNPVSIIQKKIDSINQELQEVSDSLPTVSLSVGVAFSDCGFKSELEGQADQALYKVKRGGRCNCSFYNENII